MDTNAGIIFILGMGLGSILTLVAILIMCPPKKKDKNKGG